MIAVEGAVFSYDYTPEEIRDIARRLKCDYEITFDDERRIAFLLIVGDTITTYEGARFLFRDDKRGEILWRYLDDDLEDAAEAIDAPDHGVLYSRHLNYEASVIPKFELRRCNW